MQISILKRETPWTQEEGLLPMAPHCDLRFLPGVQTGSQEAQQPLGSREQKPFAREGKQVAGPKAASCLR